MKLVFCNCDTTDFQTNSFKILLIRMLNALCCLFLKFTSLAPLVAIFFIIFSLYFMLQSPEKIDVLRMVEPRSFAVSANLRFKTLFYNLILKFLLHARPPQDGTTSEDEDF